MGPGARGRLRAEWDALLGPFGGAAGAVGRAFDELASRYENPDRHYHTLQHIASVLDTLTQCGAAGAPVLRLAAWFHDAVYNTHAGDNEERSADYAGAVLRGLGVPGDLVREAGRLILLTKTHQVADDDAAGQLLLDADLAVLGAPAPEYDAYAAAVRREYAWVPEQAFREGRARILEGFLRRPRIFRTTALAGREAPARDNLRRELDALGAGR
jgi:predicted metal-dependent HD superfamily phosphohydrolase